ncbi:VirD4-like conjugal transfer protein, CD1115 family [Neomoorella glycerini]|uniref:VirD4-like conjugal transfer protein, CD1115 family n=1 Tax=Neomoorella glycerini TaxID=55779 RepID=UPI0012E21F88|nr:type IV secretory system conjugative DNA transfer family protein [Moorella glycerini]
MKFRHVILLLLVLSDLLLAPLVLKLPLFMKAHGMKPGLEAWKKETLAHPLAGPAILVKDEKMRNTWIWLQPAFGAAALSILWPASRRKSKARDDIGGPEAAGQGQHGTARWRTRKEIARTLTPWDLTGKLPGGFVVGAEAGNRFTAWLDASDTHCLVIGSTRSGKSRRITMPTIWALARAGQSMLVTDPKGELYAMAAGYLQLQGYKVVLIDLRDPGRGNRWNPLEPVIKSMREGNIPAASQAAWDVGNIITHQQPHYGDAIWPQAQESLTAALALAVADQAPEGAKHLASAYALLTELGSGGGEKLDEYFRRFPRGHPARAAYGVAALSEDKLRSSIFTGTAAQLRLWADPEVAWLTAAQDHDITILGLEKAAVFLVVPDERSTRNVLATLYISQVYQALVDIAQKRGGKLPVRVNFLLDEIGNLPPVPDFDHRLTVAAGRGMRFLLAVQDLGQLKDKYKEAAGTIVGNCATWVYLSTTREETAKTISAMTGQYTVRTESYSSQVRAADYSSGTTEALTGRPLLLPDEVRRWPKGWALILQARENPARLPLPDISEWPVAGELKPVAIDKPDQEVIAAPPVWLPGKPAGGGGEAGAGEPGQSPELYMPEV